MKIELFGIQVFSTIPPTHRTKTQDFKQTQTNQNKPKQTNNGFSKKHSYGTRRGAEGERGRKKYLG